MTAKDSFREICLLLMDEIIAYELVFSEIAPTSDQEFLESRLAHNRRRAALRLSAVGKFSEIQRRIAERGLSREWSMLIQSRKPKTN